MTPRHIIYGTVTSKFIPCLFIPSNFILSKFSLGLSLSHVIRFKFLQTLVVYMLDCRGAPPVGQQWAVGTGDH
uniref:Uncharacterized protein n=1 Tax=Lepeophtheirus salmonis TaxID=72036 RepID=A0A0K2TY01_LEPSM